MISSRGFWRNFLTGLLIVAPAFFTITILRLMFGWVYRMVIDPAARLVAFGMSRDEASLMVHVVIAISFVLGITLIGFGARVLLIRKFFSAGEDAVRKMPMVGKIYGTMREIANTFTGQRRSLFNRVVLLEWPRPGMYSIGFVTSEREGEVQEKTPEHGSHVFIPTTPNPTSGFLVLAPRDSLIPLGMSVEEGLRLVISGGASGPNVKLPQR